MLTANGGCEHCVSSLLEIFCENFPQFKEIAQEDFRKRFYMELKGFMRGKELC
ncbi:MAG: hypothetical protein KIH08_05790 [Candidatus Freyarchaeota archaeon]|nr:hypothetical protein [Candidatus Jordarchaeia archaeon]MBS7269205.1 hypothetical protein [Candidatus Jordarchaeia archaeon]MBS7279566.1 hypothetical protein [Candidatus Jordarchaeia archaeon]